MRGPILVVPSLGPEYGEAFRSGTRADARLDTVLEKKGMEESLHQLLKGK